MAVTLQRFPFIVQETGRKPAKLEIEVQVLVKGPFLWARITNRSTAVVPSDIFGRTEHLVRSTLKHEAYP